MPSSWRLLLACTLALACQTACDNRKVDSLERELVHRDGIIRSLEAQNEQIAQRCQQIDADLLDLRAEYDNLKAQSEELSQWSQKVARRFGPSIWYFGESEKPLPVKTMQKAEPARLVAELNRMFDRSGLPHFTLTDIKGDVAFVRVEEELQLTQTMGTTGATSYIQAVTYTLTSLPGIDYVEFAFKAGDHAIPGRYSR